MNIEVSSFPSAAGNPFAALLSPELVVAAHERMTSRVAGVVHRPLDKPRRVKAGQEVLAALDAEVDAEVDAETFDEVDMACDSSRCFPDIVVGSYGDFIQLRA